MFAYFFVLEHNYSQFKQHDVKKIIYESNEELKSNFM